MIRRLKLLVLSVLSMSVMSLALAGPVAAFDLFGDPCANNSDAAVCKDGNAAQSQDDNSIYGPNGVVSVIVNILSIIIGVAAIIVIIISGIQYMVSTGDPTKVNNAKNAILYALVGLMIAVVARTVVVFVINKL